MNKEEILNTFLLANIPEIITQEEFDDVKKAIKDLQQENQESKKKYENAVADYETTMAEKNKLETQQKAFIKYLEKKLNFYKINTQGYSMNLVEEILQKYKSIIGVSDETN